MFGRFGKFFYICLQLNNQKHWRKKKPLLTINRRYHRALPVDFPAYVFEAEHFFLRAQLFCWQAQRFSDLESFEVLQREREKKKNKNFSSNVPGLFLPA